MLAFKRWLTLPVFEDDEGKTATARHLHVMTWLSLVMLAAYAAALPIAAPQLAHRVVIVAPLLIMQVAVLRWLRRGQVVWASLISLSGYWVIMAFSTFISGGVRSAPFGGNVLIVLTAAILLGRQAAFGFAALSIVEGTLLVWMELAGRVPPLSTTPVSALLLQTVYLVVGTASLQFATFSIKEALERARRELSERRRVEEKYRSIVENAVDGIFQSTPAGRFLSINPAMARMYGYASPQEMLHSVTDIRGQVYADPGQRAQLVQRLEADGRVSGYEMQDRRQDGSVFWTSMNVRAVRDQHGQTLYYEGSVEDVTERKRVEEALRISEDKFSKAFRASPDIISISSLKDGCFIEINEGFENVLGFRRDEVIGRTALELNTWRRPEERRAALALLETQRQIRGQEVVYQAKDGRLVNCLLSAEIIDLNAEPHLLAVSRDITERKQAEEQLQQRLNELAAVNEISQGLTAQLELNATLKFVAEKLWQAFDIQGLYVALYDSEANLLHFLYWQTPDHPGQISPVPPGGLTGTIVRTRQPLLINQDYEQRFAELGGTRLPAANRRNPQAWLGVPMYARNEFIGIISVHNYEHENAFTEADVRLLATIGANVGIAIQNAQLYTAAQQELAERKHTQAALHDSEEKFRTIIEQASDGVALVDEQGLIQEWNQAQENIAGLKRAEVIGIPFWDVQLRMMLPERRSAARLAELKATLLDWLRTGQLRPLQQPLEVVIVTPKGETRFIQQTMFLIRTDAGNRIGSMARDITERKQAEKEIQSLAKFPSENPHPVLRLDQDGAILYANEASRLLLQDWAAEVGGQAPKFWQAQVTDALGSQSKRTAQVTCGELVYSFVVAPVSHAGYVNLYGSDITERKSAEAEREKLIAELETRNAELERFTYTVSHELKAPLVTIQGFLGFLEKDAVSGNLARLKADVGRITQATDKMQRLLNELLELSRIGRLMNSPQAVPFETIVREALELVREHIQERGAQVIVAPDLPIVFGDRVRLVEVVQNLVDNAAKFMGEQPAPRLEIGTSGADADGRPILFVRDNGLGIEPQYHQRVFGLFNKLDAQTEGTGVGLALVKRIVEVHGGRIWVESEGRGHGTAFCFTLPRPERPAAF